MDSSPTTTVSILDKEYRVSCPRNEEEGLQKAARYLNDKMRNIRSKGIIGSERIAIMAALNISYELLQNRSEGLLENSDAQAHIKQMLDKLDEAMMTMKE